MELLSVGEDVPVAFLHLFSFEFKDLSFYIQLFKKMISRVVLVILVLSHVGLSLHYQIHDQQGQMVSDDQYFKGLIPLQNNLSNAMDKVKLQINNMAAKVKTQGSPQAQDITTLQQGLNDQRDALNNVENYIRVPLTVKPCNATVAVRDSRDALRKKSNQVNDSVQSLKKELGSCLQCVPTTDLNLAILRQQIYIKAINQMQDSNCTKTPKPLEPQSAMGLVDLSQSMFKNNLDVKNWGFGNITQDQYKYEVFANSIKYNLTSCPIEKPFVNPTTNDCFNCPDNLKFNLGAKTCQPCPNNFKFDLTTAKCQSPCAANEFYNTNTKKCDQSPTDSICPLDKPIWNSVNKVCDPCPAATPIYDQTKKACIACPAGTSWAVANQKCLPDCPGDNIYDPAAQKCVPKPLCQAGTQWNNTLRICEVVCAAGTFLNTRTSQCEKLEPGKCNDLQPIWNQTTLACEICPEKTPVWNKNTQKCEPCPPITPVYDYTQFKCVDKICDKGLKWNQAKLKCSPQTQVCAKEHVYVFASESCVNKCEPNHTYYKDNDTCQCFPQKPVFNAATRICVEPPCPNGQKWNPNLLNCTIISRICNASQTYNFTAGQCVDKCQPNIIYIAANDTCMCLPQKPVFDVKTRKCLEPLCNPGFKWNVNLLRCSPLDKNCSIWQEYNFTTEQCITKCEVNRTYVKQDDSCICTAEYPLFNVKTRTCTPPVCPAKSLWNKNLLKCSATKMDCQPWQAYDFQTENCAAKCEIGQIYFETTDSCTCPAERPQWDQAGKKCAEPRCDSGLKWNSYLIACAPIDKKCQNWQFYNFTSGTCEDKCQVGQTLFKQNDTCSCPPDRPFYNITSKVCTEPACPNATKWNKILRACTLIDKPCLAWQTYSFDQAKCLVKCQVNHTYEKETDLCSCTADLPNFDLKTRKCTEPACQPGNQWNKDLIKCSQLKKNCTQSQTYNFTTENCDDKCEVNVTYVRLNDTCLCPVERPMFDATTRKCVNPQCAAGTQWNAYLIKCSPANKNCSTWQVYNFTTEECVAKCGMNQIYYKDNDTCSCTPQQPIYDKASTNCLEPPCPTGLMWNRFLIKCSPPTKVCEKWQVYNFTFEECVDVCEGNHTYFKENNTCSCFPEAPLFDMNLRKCMIPPCPNGTQWNRIKNKCSIISKNCSVNQWYNFTHEQCDPKCAGNITYYNDTDSCQCTAQFPYFDKKTRTCVDTPCPAGLQWNKFLLKCSPVKKVCDKWEFYDFSTENCTARCEVNHTYYHINDTCECFPQKPSFNKSTRLCEDMACAAGLKWNPNLKICASILGSCQRWQLYNFTNGTCINKCDANQTYFANNDTCSCLPAAPMWNAATKKCVPPVCTFGQTWNGALAQCSCQQGFQLSTALQACVPKCGPNMFLNGTRQCQCNAGYLMNDNGFGCCQSGHQFNPFTQSCDKMLCKSGYALNPATKQCQQILVKCPAGTYLNTVTQQCISCPTGLVYNSSTHICQTSTNNLCHPGYVFNPTTKLCDSQSKNCSTGLYFNNNTQTCLPLFATNPQTANLITTNMSAYRNVYASSKNVNNQLKDCANPTPFYDQISNSCVKCPSTHPYFNLDKNKCMSCGSGTYNSSTYSCASRAKKDYNFDPTIGRFVMNVI